MIHLKNGVYEMIDGPFKPTWESLGEYRCPQWYRDAKLGIWAHWGPQAQPGVGDWYARHLYIEGNEHYQHHVAHYGHPSEIGYKEIVRQWQAEKWDAEALMERYVRAGAKYFVALGAHHDNFDCWDSTYHRWNSVLVGPHKDIVGTWRNLARDAGVRFGVSEHLARSYSWFNTNKGADTKGPKAGIPYDGNDPQYADFYFPPHDGSDWWYPKDPPEWWKWQWYARLLDLIQQYEPDYLYTDGAIPFGEIGRRMAASYYNASVARSGSLDAVYTIKDVRAFDRENGSYNGEYVDGIATQDVERGVADRILTEPWQTCTCIGNWYYRQPIEYKTTRCVVQILVDVVSKNGNLLLNFPLRGDGTLDDEATAVADALGDWMRVNGEAIYGTRPWDCFGEGPTRGKTGEFSETELPYTAADFRFTTRDQTLYAIMLGWPANGETVITSLTPDRGSVAAVELVGSDARVAWQQDGSGVHVTLPAERPCENAWSFRISFA